MPGGYDRLSKLPIPFQFPAQYQPIVLPPFILSLIVIVGNSNKLTAIVANSWEIYWILYYGILEQ